uniref:dehydrogenase n=1 Tax=Cyanobium sp. TaxID=2164130 RepID=UPI0040471547
MAVAGIAALAIVQVAIAGLTIAGLGTATGARAQTWAASSDPLTGPRARYSKDWIGMRPVEPNTEILVVAGHSDSQGIGGAGTRGAAASLYGAKPMQIGITDELFWNLLTAQEVVRLGQERGLKIRFYDPPQRSIASGNDPRTTWSVGKAHVAQGGYALEIHYDAYGRDGVGSGLIPPINKPLNQIDESLAKAFGAYPQFFRDGLGAPKRGIAILEIGKLEGSLENALRNPQTRIASLQAIATRIVDALAAGLGIESNGQAISLPISPPPDVARSDQ